MEGISQKRKRDVAEWRKHQEARKFRTVGGWVTKLLIYTVVHACNFCTQEVEARES